MLCYRCGSHVPDSAERCDACGQRQVGTARMPSATGLRKKLNPALLAGAPYREGEVMAGRYQVRDAVGVGPLGFVLRCADRELGIDVSLKLIHPRFVQTGEEREAFSRALDPARRFLHPSLTRLHDVGNDQGWPYFTYTFLDGLPLRRIIDSRLAKGQTFALDEVEPILGQLMSALEAAHPVGAHGDLKAENILVLPDMLKVTDWGVAAGVPRPPFVQAERQKGAHRHLAPEYLAGLALDPRADVYSLGVLVGEMLTGLTPEDEIPELRALNPDLPDAVEGFYRRALSERPETRFRSVREMFESFAAVVEGKPLPGAAPVVAEPPDEVVEDGFEVVDFVETQTVVVQPEQEVAAAPPVAEPEPEPVAAAASEELQDPPASPVAAAELAPAQPEAPAPPPLADLAPPLSSAAASEEVEPPPAPVDASPERDFWAETSGTADPKAPAEAPAAVESTAAEPAGALWSDTDDEDEVEAASHGAEVSAPASIPEPAQMPAPALTLAAAHTEAEPAPGPEPERPAAAPPPPEPPAPFRPLPVVPRIADRPSLVVPAVPVTVPAHLTGTAPRPAVPTIGLWGPGARRTGTHAAVAVAASSAAPAVVETSPVPAPVRPLASPTAAVPRIAPVASPPPVAVMVSDAPLPTTSSSNAAEPKPGGHQGGLWSPGAALAELVSEIQSEDARQVSAPGGTPAVELAARAVAEQRPARERLALMSATDEPTAPAPAVSGRPRKVRPAPAAAPAPSREAPRDLWLKRGLLLAVVFAIGMLGAVLLARAH